MGRVLTINTQSTSGTQLTGRHHDRPAGPHRRLSRGGRLLVKVAAVLSAPLLTLTGVFTLPSHAAVPQGFQTGHQPASTGWRGEYWNDGGGIPTIPTTPPDLVRNDRDLSFDWGEGAPAPQITPDHFMVRWTRTDVLSAGLYRFTGAMDDGIRVYVDNNPIVDSWTLPLKMDANSAKNVPSTCLGHALAARSKMHSCTIMLAAPHRPSTITAETGPT